MIKFEGRIVQFGFGAVGKSFYEKLSKEIKFNDEIVCYKPVIYFYPEEDIKGGNWQAAQSIYAIGSGGIFGRGLGQSRQKYLWLPEAQNDFIFSIVCEELGVMGASLLLLMFIYLLYRIYSVAQKAEDLFGRMLATGVFSHIALQVVMNIAVVTGALPNTGVTLPFISYGGTATVFLLIELGMVLNVQKLSEYKRIERIRETRLS